MGTIRLSLCPPCSKESRNKRDALRRPGVEFTTQPMYLLAADLRICRMSNLSEKSPRSSRPIDTPVIPRATQKAIPVDRPTNSVHIRLTADFPPEHTVLYSQESTLPSLQQPPSRFPPESTLPPPYPPPTTPDDLPSPTVHNLTGSISRMSDLPVGGGGCADIYVGELSRGEQKKKVKDYDDVCITP